MHCLFETIQTHTVTCMEMYIFVHYSYLYCQQLVRIRGEGLWNLEIILRFGGGGREGTYLEDCLTIKCLRSVLITVMG